MARYRNNKGKILFSPKFLALCFILCAGQMLYPDRVSSGPYLNSAHGSSYGVLRTSLSTPPNNYDQGNCAHCHEQHASIGGQTITPQKYVLFYGFVTACDMICYRCHSATGAEMQVNNYLYGISFGGYTPLTFPGIYSHFCAAVCAFASCGSRHSLEQIYNSIKNYWGYPADPGWCSACHNPHLAQRIGSPQFGNYDPSKSTITRPSQHYNNPLNLWGDDASERMDQYASSVGGHYLAPYYGSGFHDPTTGPFEPAGNSTSNGSNLPDYVTFCMDCHQYVLLDPERSTSVKLINWSSTGDKHGGRASGDKYNPGGMSGYTYEQGDLRAPYSDANKEAGYNYVLSCTDCHEPHGSPNRLHLIRRFVNGEGVAAETALPCDSPDDWIAICGRCHTNIHTTFGGCFVCHYHGYYSSFGHLF